MWIPVCFTKVPSISLEVHALWGTAEVSVLSIHNSSKTFADGALCKSAQMYIGGKLQTTSFIGAKFPPGKRCDDVISRSGLGPVDRVIPSPWWSKVALLPENDTMPCKWFLGLFTNSVRGTSVKGVFLSWLPWFSLRGGIYY